METKQPYETSTEIKPEKSKFLMTIPTELLDYYRELAAVKGCFVSSEMVRALKAWRTRRDISQGEPDVYEEVQYRRI